MAEPDSASAGAELLTQLAAAQRAGRAPGHAHNEAQLGFLPQQQGNLMNLADPNAQAHLFQLLAQLQGAPSAWGAPSQSGSLSLDHLLAQIARQPELAASLPALLASLTGGLGMAPPGPQPPSPPREEKPVIGQQEAEAGPSSYALQLFGSSGSGRMEAEAEDEAGAERDPAAAKANSAKCAKEKNRQAQRRFRERQKTLITSLKEAADRLGKQVEEQRRQIEALEKENQVLKVILQEKNKP